MTVHPLLVLRVTLDRALLGQAEAKTGLLLALLAREHALLTGPPGCGKSLLAEVFSHAVERDPARLCLHRDTRIEDLLGDPVLRRRPWQGGERLERRTLPGPLLAARIWVLDDLSCAPGPVLAPLLRMLSERRMDGHRLALESAIATALPPGLEACADPRDATFRDAFAIRIRMRGLLTQGRFRDARAVLDHEPGRPEEVVLEAAALGRLQDQAERLPVASAARVAFRRLLMRLGRLAREARAQRASDRILGRVALRIFRAHALLRGAGCVEPEDLRALRYMLPFHVGESPEAEVPILDRLLEELLDERPAESPAPPGAAAATRGEARGAGLEAAAGLDPAPAPGVRHQDLEAVGRGSGTSHPGPADVDRVLRGLVGRIERGRAGPREEPGGMPRGYRALRRLEEIQDADPVEVMGYLEGELPGPPRVYRRERQRAGGSLALLRDVSASMEGRLGRWAGQVVSGLARAGTRSGMRVGYLEFNHQATRYHVGGRFFHRRYSKLVALADSSRAGGQTHYEAALRLALEEFRRVRGLRDRHIVLLTDGLPVLGDPEVRRERALARELRVRIHTVFIGFGDYPPILDQIARETGGASFLVRPRPSGRLGVRERAEGI